MASTTQTRLIELECEEFELALETMTRDVTEAARVIPPEYAELMYKMSQLAQQLSTSLVYLNNVQFAVEEINESA
jgi:uncharacterized protein YoxC